MTALAIAMLTAAVLTLGWWSESAAQGSQTWEFRGFAGSGVVSPFVARPFVRTALVANDGAFILSGVPCPGGTFDLAGVMVGTTVMGRALGGNCGPSTSAAGALDAPFPAARSFASSLEIVFTQAAGVVTITGRLLAIEHPDAGARTLLDAALLATSAQDRNIGLRLNAVRNGLGGGGSFGGFSLTLNGDTVPVGAMLASLLSAGAASAGRPPTFDRLGLYVNGQGSLGERDGRGFVLTSLMMGADYRFTDQLVLGAAFGYARTALDQGGGLPDASSRTYALSLYGTYYGPDRFYVQSALTYGHSDFALARQDLPRAQAPSGTITGKTDGASFTVSGGAGYEFVHGGLTFGPIGQVTYSQASRAGYTERGPLNSSASAFHGTTIESLTTRLGGEAMYRIRTPWGFVVPQVQADWEHELKRDGPGATAYRLADGAALPDPPRPPDRNYFNVGAGVIATFGRRVGAVLHYEEVLGQSGFTSHSFKGTISVKF